ncbi:MAG: tRNA pseudouridine(38-40) synthase TruA [Deltaproteobacteria bacterium]|jgi:tRNA pseudouridine38-40 synthase|nr:tRNA pseudouridine(38-40) synthase TruA [Deltaproteobacteria bacterium]
MTAKVGKNYKLTLAYDGTDFLGWQRQTKGPTLQGVLEEALFKLCGHPVTVWASGRTDAGVHARAQVVNFWTSSPRSTVELVRGGNAILPMSMAILSAQEVTEDFNARFSAVGKTYAYDFSIAPVRNPLLVFRAWHVGPKLDWDRIKAALPLLVGNKDFKAFGSAGSEVKTTVRTISEAVLTKPEEDIQRLTLTGSGFLRHMVRTIAGTLWLIGRGRMSPEELTALIESKDRRRAGPVAPPQGLFLERVYYDPAL